MDPDLININSSDGKNTPPDQSLRNIKKFNSKNKNEDGENYIPKNSLYSTSKKAHGYNFPHQDSFNVGKG